MRKGEGNAKEGARLLGKIGSQSLGLSFEKGIK